MGNIKVVEIPNDNWNIHWIMEKELVDGLTTREYLLSRGIEWEVADRSNIKGADLLFFKGVMDRPPHPRRVLKAFFTEIEKRLRDKPYLTLIGEPRQHCRLSYLLSDKDSTLCVAPGEKFERIFIPTDWMDPRLDSWNERQDRFCWIGRPMPDRIRAAKELVNNGIELDIYSRQPWPLDNWKGFALNDYETALRYKYRVVFENYPTHRYHSEKLFLSIKSGCVTFYRGDPKMELPEIDGLYVLYSVDTIVDHDYDEKPVLNEMRRFMGSDAWKMYSYHALIDKIIGKIGERVGPGHGR